MGLLTQIGEEIEVGWRVYAGVTESETKCWRETESGRKKILEREQNFSILPYVVLMKIKSIVGCTQVRSRLVKFISIRHRYST